MLERGGLREPAATRNESLMSIIAAEGQAQAKPDCKGHGGVGPKAAESLLLKQGTGGQEGTPRREWGFGVDLATTENPSEHSLASLTEGRTHAYISMSHLRTCCLIISIMIVLSSDREVPGLLRQDPACCFRLA